MNKVHLGRFDLDVFIPRHLTPCTNEPKFYDDDDDVLQAKGFFPEKNEFSRWKRSDKLSARQVDDRVERLWNKNKTRERNFMLTLNF